MVSKEEKILTEYRKLYVPAISDAMDRLGLRQGFMSQEIRPICPLNSDATKIRAVQDAMASEPKPAAVVRQPKPRAVLDDGPLVLVETKKDLSQIRLPFDNTPPPAP